ncbi:PIN domain-containing protein [Bacillus subtilis]|uniref:PIN domain-containing protein n=1 Tax=Bacillus subtilis TaxID=1423 RepID=UPI003D1C5A01
MNIFLDTNVFYKDPFLTKGKKTILLRLAKHDDVKLLINQTVLQEILRNHKKYTDFEIKKLNEAYNTLKPFINTKRDLVKVKIKTEDLLKDVELHFSELESEDQLEVIPYDGDVLSYIVEVDANERLPFVKKHEISDKKGNKRTFSEKEIRDAIIWYSYKTYIEKNSLTDCYFISNNTNDFGAVGAKKTPSEKPYEIHPNISAGVEITAYKNVHDFLTHNKDKIKEFFKEETFHLKLLTEDFYDQIQEELEQGLTEDIVSIYLLDEIFGATQSYLSDMNPEDIHDDYFMGGYISPSQPELTNIEFLDLDIYGDTITIAAQVDMETDIDVYLYNPVHDGREDKHQYYSTDTVKVETTIVFLMSIDNEKELARESFSFKEYIKDIEPTNLNIEFESYTNINHTSMFGEDEEEYDPPEEDTHLNKDSLIDEEKLPF